MGLDYWLVGCHYGVANETSTGVGGTKASIRSYTSIESAKGGSFSLPLAQSKRLLLLIGWILSGMSIIQVLAFGLGCI